MNIPKNIIISRIDKIGDVVLSLPMATVLKKHFPDMVIGFMGTKYTRALIETCESVDQFIDIDDFMTQEITLNGEKPQAIIHVLPFPSVAKRAKTLNIAQRIGTTTRLYHWLNCNQFVRLSRKNSDLHEAQLNLKLLEPFDIKTDYTLSEITQLYAMTKLPELSQSHAQLLSANKFKLILHPKSYGSAREWDLDYYAQLINLLDQKKFQIFISGTANEKETLKPLTDKVSDLAMDISGIMNLREFIAFINACDGLVACSTGPLHIAAALQKNALGIYPPIKRIHPGRWQPVGVNAQTFVLDKDCNTCKKNRAPCECMQAIKPEQLAGALNSICI